MKYVTHALVEASNDNIVWDMGFLIGKEKGKQYVVSLDEYGNDTEEDYLAEISKPYKKTKELKYTISVRTSFNEEKEYLDFYTDVITHNGNKINIDYFPETKIDNNSYLCIGFTNVPKEAQQTFRDRMEGLPITNREDLYNGYRKVAKELNLALETNGLDMNLNSFPLSTD